MDSDLNTQIIRAFVTGPMFDDRPKAIRGLRLGDIIQLVRQPDNPVDSNAIRLLTMEDAIIGFLPRQIAAWLAPFLDSNTHEILAEVIELYSEVITGTLRAQVAFRVPDVWLEIANPGSAVKDGKVEYCVEETFGGLYVYASCDGERVALLRDILKANDLPPIRFGFSTWEAKDGKSYEWYFKLGSETSRSVEDIQKLLKIRLKGLIKESSGNSLANIRQAIRDELQHLRVRHRLAQEQLATARNLGQYELQKREDEVKYLWQQIETKELQEAEFRKEQLQTEARMMAFEAKMRAQIGVLQNRPPVSEGLRETIERHIASSLNPTQVLHLIAALADENLVVLDSAWKSADAASKFRYPERLFDLLYKLAFEYRSQLMRGYDPSYAESLFGGDYAEKESNYTVSKPACLQARTFRYKSSDWVMLKHLKIGVGVSAVDCLRVHFDWDQDEQKIVIGHCGEHLPTG